MTSIVAGTKYRGQFEERLKVILEELEANPNIVIFIDEIHTLVGSGNSAGSMDGSNIFKPALARGEIQCIGATTLNYFHYTSAIDQCVRGSQSDFISGSHGINWNLSGLLHI